MIKLSRHLVVSGLLLWGWCAPMAGPAVAVESAYVASVEYEVKAAFIHNFTRFIEWSPEAFEGKNSPFRIGILGTGPIDEPLMNLTGKKVDRRSLEVSRVQNLQEVSQYQIIFVNPSEKNRTRSILKTLQDTSILTIGDMNGFAEQCGVINFYLQNGKVRFEINNKASRRQSLHISSRLLRLARIVDTPCN